MKTIVVGGYLGLVRRRLFSTFRREIPLAAVGIMLIGLIDVVYHEALLGKNEKIILKYN